MVDGNLGVNFLLQRERFSKLSFKSTAKCKPVGDELPSADSWGVSQIHVGHLGWTAFLAAEITAYIS